ncbi:aliphatic sulfonate ABC transporter substrate-binding protein [Actinoplanes sp. DH11]|uniref:aliphatic sulfonate ABC transporter substrate-binding protein n=1 Tax=Actinoplanes sp. DH11 TaxID=2857011 RepID=UPI001E2F4CDD|nr:aliphatic sulfonate ABC transporter substrate-binding protein [Actinoplanes sp. DH11]
MSVLPRRSVLAGLAGIGAAALAGCGAAEQDAPGGTGVAERVRIGYIADFTGASLMAIANDQDLWAKNGLRPELSVFTNGPLQVQALGAGDLDFGYVGPGAMWLPASGKARVVAINSLGFADRVIAQPGIAEAEDLAGKRIGVPEGTSGDMLVRLTLQAAGLTEDDVERVTMDAATVVTAFSSGKIDAAGIWYPLIDTIKKRVPDLVELAKNDDYYPAVSFPSAYLARNEVVTGEAPLVRKMLAVLREATDIRALGVPEAIEVTSRFLRTVSAEQLRTEAYSARFLTSAELAAKSADGTVNGWLTELNELFQQIGKLKKVTDPATYYDGAAYAA